MLHLPDKLIELFLCFRQLIAQLVDFLVLILILILALILILDLILILVLDLILILVLILVLILAGLHFVYFFFSVSGIYKFKNIR